MRFNISNVNTIYESDDFSSRGNFKATDKVFDDKDVVKAFMNTEPISGEMFKAMKEAASDPSNLKIAACANPNGGNSLFIEAFEFASFCEAANLSIKEAAEEIVKAYSDEVPNITTSDINVVFPSDALNKNVIGGEHNGLETNNDWSMQLMRGCCRYGLKPRSGVEMDGKLN